MPGCLFFFFFLIETIKQFSVQIALAKCGFGSVEVHNHTSLKIKYSSGALDLPAR